MRIARFIGDGVLLLVVSGVPEEGEESGIPCVSEAVPEVFSACGAGGVLSVVFGGACFDGVFESGSFPVSDARRLAMRLRMLVWSVLVLVASVAFGEITFGGKKPASKSTALGAFGGGMSRYDPNSLANPYGAGSRYKTDGLLNPYSPYGSKYSNQSWRNPYATDAPRMYQNGQYRGKLSTSKYDPDSVSNPYGRYGSKYSPDSVKNRYGAGSRYSNQTVIVKPR